MIQPVWRRPPRLVLNLTTVLSKPEISFLQLNIYGLNKKVLPDSLYNEEGTFTSHPARNRPSFVDPDPLSVRCIIPVRRTH